METILIVATLVEVLIVITVLAVYLVLIARTLRSIARTLGLITFGVRAIDKQTEPIGPALKDVNQALERSAAAIEQVADGRTMTG